MTDVEMTGSSL